MPKTGNYEIINVIWSLILGKVSFLISGVIACIIILKFDNYILGTVIAGGIGGLILGLFCWKHKMIGRMSIAGLIAVPIGLLGGFIIVEGLGGGLGFLFPSVADFFKNTGIADIVAVILTGIFFGVVFGAIVYGRRYIWLFSVVCGAVSVISGSLVEAMNAGYYVKVLLGNMFQIFGRIDLNFLVIITGFGAGVGLSIGLLGCKKFPYPVSN